MDFSGIFLNFFDFIKLFSKLTGSQEPVEPALKEPLSDRPRKFELFSLCASKGGQKACVTIFESNFVGRSTENILQSNKKSTFTIVCWSCF